tara:strand:+ start:199 stop:1230 length:1032 start_codon:yes stop_codon:yes gene_type:complete
MAYIGKTPQVGNYVKLDAITCSSTNTYNLAQDSVAFTPESALHMMVSLNGVIQAPLTSFSVSGSTITFLPSSGTLSSSDTIDFILVLGNTLDIGTPSDSTVTNAKTNFVSSSSSAGLSIKGDGTSSGTGGKLQLNCSDNSHGIKLESPAHSAGQSYTLKFPTGNVTADKFLKVASITGSGVTGVGQLSFADAGGITESSLITASGTEVDFGSIPSTAKRITIIFKGASLSADGQNVIIQLGTSSGLTSSGYLSNSHYGGGGVGRTDGFSFYCGGGSANVVSGALVIYHLGSNKYSSNHSAKYNQNNGLFGGGDVTLGGTLDRLRIRPDGNTSFDAGEIKLFIE